MADIDVSNPLQLEVFLNKVANREGGLEHVVAFAVRAALRVAPYLFKEVGLARDSDLLLLQALRTLSFGWIGWANPHSADKDPIEAPAFHNVLASLDTLPPAFASAFVCNFVTRNGATPAGAAIVYAYKSQEIEAYGLTAALQADIAELTIEKPIHDEPLWPMGVPLGLLDMWVSIERRLESLHQDWEVWTEWYDARLRGRPTHPELSAAANERIEVARVLEIEEEDWEQGPAHVNAKIKAIIERETERHRREHDETDQTASIGQDPLDHPPPEPDPGPGPNYSIQEGQLHLDPSPPIPSDEASSAALLPLLQRATADLQQLCQKLDNTHPRLAEAVRNYAATLDAPFEGLSVPSVWAYGGLLAELRQGFEAQSPSTMTEALEPEVSAQLANVVRQHAAFILGTEQGRDLVERADRFQQAPQTIEEIREPADEILDELSDNEDLVDVETRAAHAPIRDHLRAIEWGACRTSYAGYLIVRQATFTILRVVVGKEVSVISLLGATAAAGAVAGDPNLEFFRVALPVLRDHASAILAFYKHSPELRSYAEYALDLIDAAEEKLDPRVKSEDDA